MYNQYYRPPRNTSTPPPVLDYWQLEDTSGDWQLEDGSGNWLLQS